MTRDQLKIGNQLQAEIDELNDFIAKVADRSRLALVGESSYTISVPDFVNEDYTKAMETFHQEYLKKICQQKAEKIREFQAL